VPQPGPTPELDPPTVTAPPIASTGIVELDRGVQILVAQFAAHLDAALDEVYSALSYAYPGMYADPDAPTTSKVEYRVTETTGVQRWLNPPAAVQAHRLGLKVERRVVTTTEWVVEPNPNRRQPRPVPAHPQVHPAAAPDQRRAAAEDADAIARMTPPGYPVGLVPEQEPDPEPTDAEQGQPDSLLHGPVLVLANPA